MAGLLRDRRRSTPTACRRRPTRRTRRPPTWPSCWSSRGMPFRDAHALVGDARPRLPRAPTCRWPSWSRPTRPRRRGARPCSSPASAVAAPHDPGRCRSRTGRGAARALRSAGWLSTERARWGWQGRGATPYRHELRVRYGEVDMQRRVFNAHYLAYVDDAFDTWLRGARRASFERPLRHGCSSRPSSTGTARPRFGDAARHRRGVRRWGTTSFDIGFAGIGRRAAGVHGRRHLRAVRPAPPTRRRCPRPCGRPA